MGKKIKNFIVLTIVFYIISVICGVFFGEAEFELTPEFVIDTLTSTTTLLIFGAIMFLWMLVSLSKAGNGSKGFSGGGGEGNTRTGDHFNQYYDARWIREDELLSEKKFMPTTFSKLGEVKKEGIVIRSILQGSQLLVNMYSPIHTLIIGTTGSGKTVMYVEPSIRILSRTAAKPCLVITDPKGELYQNHSLQLQENGYRLMTLDLRNPYASTRWNPMDNSFMLWQKALNLEKQINVHHGDNPADTKLKIISTEYNNEWYEFNGIAYPNREMLEADIGAKRQELKDMAELELREISSTIVPIESKQDSSWERGAQDMLFGVMLAMLEDSADPKLGMTRERFNFYNMAKIANYKDPDPENPFETLREYCGNRPKTSKVLSLVSTVINNAPNTTRSYMGILLSRLAIFQDGGICYATSYSDLSFDDFTEQPTCLFIKVPDEKESRHGIATMCISQLYKKLIETASSREGLRLKRNVHFLLDEFANLPKIEKMDSLITVGRSRGIFFSLVVQSYSQLDNKYGKEVSETIRGNCNIQIFIGTEDQKTREDFSKMCGDVSIETSSTSVTTNDKSDAGRSKNTNKQIVTRPLIYPYELGQLKQFSCIVKIFQCNPIRTDITPWFRVPQFDQRKAKPEYVPSKSLDEERIFYDIKERNRKIVKKSDSGLGDFDF
ncbi:MAG: type IV secretory system conjugative DNA transfer family protein [Clostridia bacterium]